MIIRTLLIAIAILFAAPNFIPKDINEQFVYDNKERFHPGLASINSIDELDKYIKEAAASRHIDIKSPEYDLLISYIISCRFYHGFSHWKLNENWIAAVGERFTGIGLSCKVQPEEIMQHPYAACSQQALVMMELLKRKNTDYRKVGFPHHYALEVKNNGNWYYYDPNMEPYMNLKERLHDSWKANNDALKNYYDPNKHSNLAYQFGNGQKAEFGPVNETPAQRLRLFQSTTGVLSKILWCVPLLVLVFVRRRSAKKMYMVKPINNMAAPSNLQPSFSA